MQNTGIVASLRGNVGRKVKIAFSDGEVVVGKLVCVLEEEGGIVFDLVRSNRPDKYERSDMPPCLWADLADIVGCERPTGPRS